MSARLSLRVGAAAGGALTVAFALVASSQATGATQNASTFGAPAAGFAAYHGTRLSTDPKTLVQNKAIHYSGRKLVLAQSYVGRKAAEPTIGVDRNGAIYTVASAFDAIPGNAPKNEPRTLVERSTDGGRTWHVQQPSIAGQNSMVVSTDPYLYVDPNVSQATGRIFDIDLQGVNGAHLAYSDDQGKTWTQTVLTSAGVNDHQTLVSGPEPKSVPIPLTDPAYQKVVY
ncbi:MAG TPA: sialidase family protein, partial [Mycobacteriales bacterium]|nr:sialidase family protein [Mycobacteriales bacterium]